MSGDTPTIVTRHRRRGAVGFSQVGPLGRWRPELEATTDRIPGAEVHLGESLVHDRRLVPGSPVQLGERLAEDETADDGVKVRGLHNHGHDVWGRIAGGPLHPLAVSWRLPADVKGGALAMVLAVTPGTASRRVPQLLVECHALVTASHMSGPAVERRSSPHPTSARCGQGA